MSTLKKVLKILMPFALSLVFLWWMYRETDWQTFWQSIRHDMKWSWMLFSLIFGVTAQTLRARRWKLALAPMGEHPRLRSCVDSVFVSYAASLVVPRVGEVMRCGTLKRSDGTSFSKALGTVVTERIVDSLIIVGMTGIALLMQLPTFLNFLDTTGTDLNGILNRFTQTGYIVTFACIVLIVVTVVGVLWRFKGFKRGKDALLDLKAGILSLRRVKSPTLYVVYSLGIWISYFLHFYIALFSFDFSSHITPVAGLLTLGIGCFAQLVPTPNGAGPWHFAVKTMFVIYGMADADAVMVALVVHTAHTVLIVLLGIIGWTDLNFIERRKNDAEPAPGRLADSKGGGESENHV